MIRLFAVAAFALAIATSAQAMSPPALPADRVGHWLAVQSPNGKFEGCGVGCGARLPSVVLSLRLEVYR
jgi:hypothetical protein